MRMYLLLPQSLHFCLFQLVFVGGGAQDALLVVAVAAHIVVGVVSIIALVAVTGEEREGGQCM